MNIHKELETAKRRAVSGDYVLMKISHMQRIGIPARYGLYRGACPDHLHSTREEALDRQLANNSACGGMFCRSFKR